MKTDPIEIEKSDGWCNLCANRKSVKIVFNANKTHTQPVNLCKKCMELLLIKLLRRAYNE